MKRQSANQSTQSPTLKGKEKLFTSVCHGVSACDAMCRGAQLPAHGAVSDDGGAMKNEPKDSLPVLPLLRPEPLLKKRRAAQAALLRLAKKDGAGLLGQDEVRGNLPAIRTFLGHKIVKDRRNHAQTVRTKSEGPQENSNAEKNGVANCAHIAHSVRNSPHLNMTSESATRGYAHGKKRTNVSIDESLVKWGRKHFRKTAYGSMSNAFESYLRTLKNSEERKKAKAKTNP